MKKLAIIILALFVMGCSENKNDLIKQNLKGEVKSITENTYFAIEKFGEITKGDKSNEFYELDNNFKLFNDLGNLIEQKNVWKRGNIKYKYDSNNNLIEEKSFKNYDRSSSELITYEYNLKNHLIEKNEFEIIEGKTKLDRKSKYINDESGNPTLTSVYYSDGLLRFKYTDEYINGKIRKENRFGKDGELTSKYIYSYDNNGNIIKEIKYSINNSISFVFETNIYKYNDKKDVIENISSTLNILLKNETNKFNYVYSYDKKNNFIKKIIFKDGTPTKIIERVIEYY